MTTIKRKTAAKKVTVKKAAAKKVTVKKAAAKKVTVKKAAAKKVTVKKATKTQTKKGDIMSDTKTQETETAEVVLTPIQMCEKMHERGMSEDEIILALAKHTKMPIIKAVQVHGKFKISAGLVQSKADRKRIAYELIENHVQEDGTIDAVAAIKAVSAELAIGHMASRSRVKAYCKENEIEMPAGVIREAIVISDEERELIVTLRKDGTSKSETLSKLMEASPDLDETHAKRIYGKVCKDENLTSVAVKKDYSLVIAWYHENEASKYATKTGFVTELKKAFPEMAKSTAAKYFGMFKFAEAFKA